MKTDASSQNQFDLAALADVIHFLDASNPTATERQDAYFHSFRCFEALAARHPGKQKRVKRCIQDALLQLAPALSKNKAALERNWAMKFERWKAGGRAPSAIADRRPVDSGNFRAPAFGEDKKKILALAVQHNGDISLAHRLARTRGQLSDDFVKYYSFDGRRHKSYVPAVVRDQVAPLADMVAPLHRGPWEAKMRGTYIQRDWSSVAPGDWFNADDLTPERYFFFYDSDGRLQIKRGQILLYTDLRSYYPLNYLLLAADGDGGTAYNSLHVRQGVLRVHDVHGLPHCGLYFEGGVWQSRLITGGANSVSFGDTERGLREFDPEFQIRRARTPRAKPIETLFRHFQARLAGGLGYVGRNEQTIKFERQQEFIARARAGKEDPRNGLLEMGEWRQVIDDGLLEFAQEPQCGKMLDGKSPAELWQERRVLRKLPEDARYILASHKVRTRVRPEGIVLTIRGERLAYYNEHTGSLIERDVFAFYNIEEPDLLTVSDLNRQNYFTVKRHLLPAMSASREQFDAVNRDRRGHQRAAKVIYDSIAHPERSSIVRDNIADEPAKELGRFHNAEVAAHREEKTERQTLSRRAASRAQEAGVALPQDVRNPAETLSALDLLAQSEARFAEEEREKSNL